MKPKCLRKSSLKNHFELKFILIKRFSRFDFSQY